MFVTMLIGVYRPDDDRLLVANAGHSPVLLRRGEATTMLPPSAPPLGVLPDLIAETVELPFAPGDVLVVATDGLAEQEDQHGEQIGYDRLVELIGAGDVQSSGALVDTLFDEVERFSGGRERDDDRTALVIRRVAGAQQ